MGDLSLFLEDHHVMMRNMVREFAEAEIAPIAAKYDESEEFPWESGAKMSKIGLFGIPFEEEYGGAGMDLLASVVAVEELARVDASHSIMVGAHTSLACTPIHRWGTEEQKRRFLTPLASGQVLGGFGLTEPGSGSDSGAMRTRAEKKGDWNLIEILVIGNRIRFVENGTQVFDFTDKPEMLKKSPIALQLHSNGRPQEFRFRGLVLTEDPQDKLVTLKK